MKILCSKCKNHFEESNLESDSEYKVQCPKCGYKFKIETKRTKVVLPSYYKTSIEESSKDLVIEKKGGGLIYYLIFGLGIMLLQLPIFSIIEAINSGNSTKFSIINIIVMFVPCFIFVLLFIILGYCNIVNKVKFRVGNEGISTSVHPYEWVSRIKNSYHKTNDINQFFVKKQLHKHLSVNLREVKYYLYHLYARTNERKNIELGIFLNLDEARGLEILIEKRLGIEDKEISGEELA